MIRICLAGSTGWVGRVLVPAISAAADLQLVSAVARSAAGQPLDGASGLTVQSSVSDALAITTDVLIDYTSPRAAKRHALIGIRRGVHVVIGSSGLDDADLEEIDSAARERGVGVIAAGNFAISAVLLQHFALIAARHMPSWEILDYAKAGKPDAPSGTVRELAARLAAVGTPAVEISIHETLGSVDARGANINGTQVHSIRLPGFVIGAQVIFGKPGELLSLRADAGGSAEPYVDGTLLAARKVGTLRGLHRGLDAILDLR
jgi:4-hydroxy-tetrahydrodipicolinate reductase